MSIERVVGMLADNVLINLLVFPGVLGHFDSLGSGGLEPRKGWRPAQRRPARLCRPYAETHDWDFCSAISFSSLQISLSLFYRYRWKESMALKKRIPGKNDKTAAYSRSRLRVRRDTCSPISKSSSMGMSRQSCDTTSGGVSTAAMMATASTTYLRLERSCS